MYIRYPFLASLAVLAACSSATPAPAPALSGFTAPQPGWADPNSPAPPRTPSGAQVHHGAFVFQTQERLKHLGYYEGEVDGVMGPKTHAALVKFQHEKGLPMTGRVDHHTYSALGLSE